MPDDHGWERVKLRAEETFQLPVVTFYCRCGVVESVPADEAEEDAPGYLTFSPKGHA